MMHTVRALTLALLTGCAASTSDTADTDVVDTDVADTDVVDTDVPSTPQNVWWLDEEEHPAIYPSLNCQLETLKLRLSASDAGGVGSLQLVLFEKPTADVTLTVNPDLNALATGQIYAAIGRDREHDNQYVAQSGSVSVTVVTTDPQEINVVFNDLPGETALAATAAMSANVGARDGAFVGACDFEKLLP